MGQTWNNYIDRLATKTFIEEPLAVRDFKSCLPSKGVQDIIYGYLGNNKIISGLDIYELLIDIGRISYGEDLNILLYDLHNLDENIDKTDELGYKLKLEQFSRIINKIGKQNLHKVIPYRSVFGQYHHWNQKIVDVVFQFDMIYRRLIWENHDNIDDKQIKCCDMCSSKYFTTQQQFPKKYIKFGLIQPDQNIHHEICCFCKHITSKDMYLL
jgi:hypothetical protein